MSYTPNLVADAGALIGNAGTTSQLPDNVAIAASLSLSGSVLSGVMPGLNETTGDYELEATDHEKILTSTDGSDVVYTLPAGLQSGLKVLSYQGGAGQITYEAGVGATIINGTQQSGGVREDNFYAEIENLGDDVYIVRGNLA